MAATSGQHGLDRELQRSGGAQRPPAGDPPLPRPHQVERPQPKARTYDLDATVGRRTLVGDDVGSAQLWTGSGPVFASGPSVEVAEVGRLGCQASLRSAGGP